MTNPTGNAKPKEILSVPQLQKLALCHTFWEDRTSLGALLLKNPPGMQEFWVQSLGREDPLEKEMATHSSVLAWEIPWTEEPGELPPMGPQSQTQRSD